MTRYCRFNGFFEEELRSENVAPEKLDLKNRSLENLFFLFQSMYDPSTTFLLSEPPDPNWTRFWEKKRNPILQVSTLKKELRQESSIFTDRFDPKLGRMGFDFRSE